MLIETNFATVKLAVPNRPGGTEDGAFEIMIASASPLLIQRPTLAQTVTLPETDVLPEESAVAGALAQFAETRPIERPTIHVSDRDGEEFDALLPSGVDEDLAGDMEMPLPIQKSGADTFHDFFQTIDGAWLVEGAEGGQVPPLPDDKAHTTAPEPQGWATERRDLEGSLPPTGASYPLSGDTPPKPAVAGTPPTGDAGGSSPTQAVLPAHDGSLTAAFMLHMQHVQSVVTELRASQSHVNHSGQPVDLTEGALRIAPFQAPTSVVNRQPQLPVTAGATALPEAIAPGQAIPTPARVMQPIPTSPLPSATPNQFVMPTLTPTPVAPQIIRDNLPLAAIVVSRMKPDPTGIAFTPSQETSLPAGTIPLIDLTTTQDAPLMPMPRAADRIVAQPQASFIMQPAVSIVAQPSVIVIPPKTVPLAKALPDTLRHDHVRKPMEQADPFPLRTTAPEASVIIRPSAKQTEHLSPEKQPHDLSPIDRSIPTPAAPGLISGLVSASVAASPPPFTPPILAPNHPQFTQQVAQTVISAMRHGSTGQIDVVLRPKELGQLRFEMMTTGDKIHVVICAERPEALDMIRRNADQLMADLRQSGFGQATFGFSDWTSQHRSETPGANRPEITGAGSTPDDIGSADLSTTPRNLTALGRLDLRL